VSTEWYYRSANMVDVGPLSPAEMRRHALDGDVEPDTLVRGGPDGQWIAAARLKGLFPSSRISRQAAVTIALKLAAETSWARPIEKVGDIITRDGGRTWVVHLVPEPIECWPGVIAFDTPGTSAVCVSSETRRIALCPVRLE
jgi:hypothetical protein